ncbi:UNVERIFIED_CONTAM: hypothetical protein Sradi_5739300 [Sesamum radiatum]|uniref:Tf2-1-like SH3-like domain-containing protein n=1 Tax=Sesamum radiatum TaxID=300843 RepID=A0AAW2L2E0_SESRA
MSWPSSNQTAPDVLTVVKYHLARTRQCMKASADHYCHEHIFAARDWVLLCLQPYGQRLVHRSVSHKLGRRYFGPFYVLCWIGALAYELELSIGARIHPHVSLLKPFNGDPTGQDEADASWVSLADFHAAHLDFDLVCKVQLDDGSIDKAQSSDRPVNRVAEPNSTPHTQETGPTGDIRGPYLRRSTRPTKKPTHLLDYY